VQDNEARVLAGFYSPDNPDANYAQGIYWPDMAAAREACHLPGYYALVEPDGRTLPCCMVEIAHEGEIGNASDRSLAQVWGGALEDIASLAAATGARVVNFLTFNPYFEWRQDASISFQARHSARPSRSSPAVPGCATLAGPGRAVNTRDQSAIREVLRRTVQR
jgi:hypothetical protein